MTTIREHLGCKEPYPQDPGAIITFLVGTEGNTENQKEFMEFVSKELHEAGSTPISADEIRERWGTRQAPVTALP